MQIIGTENCTLCFEGCVECSATNPNECLSCGEGRYKDEKVPLCWLCQQGCKTCARVADNCSSCEVGYMLLNTKCLVLPDNCISLDPSGRCSDCF